LDFNWAMWYLPAFVFMRSVFCAAHWVGLERTHLVLASQIWLLMPAFVDLYIGWKPWTEQSVVPIECPEGCFCPWAAWPWAQPLSSYVVGWWLEQGHPFKNSFLGHGLIFVPCYWIGFYFGGRIFQYLTRVADETNWFKRGAIGGVTFVLYYVMYTYGQPLLANYKDSCSVFWNHGGFAWLQLGDNIVYFAMNLSMSLLYVVFIAAMVPIHLKYLAKVCFSSLIFSGFTMGILNTPGMSLVIRDILPSMISPGVEAAWTIVVAFLYELVVGAFFAWLLPKVAKAAMTLGKSFKGSLV